jgi:4-alpha-glucanotransferase
VNEMPQKSKNKQFKRGAGILLPVSSIPANYGIGTCGAEAFQLIDFLKEAGQSYWQVLPLGPTSFGDSPYQSFSAFAGNPYFIDLNILIDEKLLTADEVSSFDWGSNTTDVDYAKIFNSRIKVLHMAFLRSTHKSTNEFQIFLKENEYWLEDYCLFMALKFEFDNRSWQFWPREIRFHELEAVDAYKKQLKVETEFWKFCQFKFFEQWSKIKKYANLNGIKIIGDIPIYAALDSADVWTHSELFQLDQERKPIKVAGVPPDAFSKGGQLWGNPLYDWEAMEQSDFNWWKMRMAYSSKIYDIIRIDHFIGMVRYFAIPAENTTAVGGAWQPGPGSKLTDAIDSAIGSAQVIAEDLGVVVPAVKRLLRKTGYPSMKVLQFAFDGSPLNEHLPCNYTKHLVVYGGTHDNDTLVGYFEKMKAKDRRYAKDYLGVKRTKDLPKALLRAAYASVANTVIFQAQDILLLPNTARMNFPSTLGFNWRWRLEKGQLTEELAEQLNHLAQIYGR